MRTIRWITFIPLAAITISVSQLVTGFIAEKMVWWIGLPIIFFFGIIITMATMVPVRWCPDVKIGAGVILSLFLLFELVALFSVFGLLSPAERVGRVLTDIYLVIGGIIPIYNSGEDET